MKHIVDVASIIPSGCKGVLVEMIVEIIAVFLTVDSQLLRELTVLMGYRVHYQSILLWGLYFRHMHGQKLWFNQPGNDVDDL